VWAPSWSTKSLILRHELCDHFRGIYNVKGKGSSNDDLMWPNMAACSTSIYADSVLTDLHADCSTQTVATTHVTVRYIGALLRGKPYTFLYENAHFAMIKRVTMRRDGFRNGSRNDIIT
jgi:hypothetical protein